MDISKGFRSGSPGLRGGGGRHWGPGKWPGVLHSRRRLGNGPPVMAAEPGAPIPSPTTSSINSWCRWRGTRTRRWLSFCRPPRTRRTSRGPPSGCGTIPRRPTRTSTLRTGSVRQGDGAYSGSASFHGRPHGLEIGLLGSSFLHHPSDVMRSIQRLRRRALAAGTLQKHAPATGDRRRRQFQILPSSDDEFCVPQYDDGDAYSTGGGYGGDGGDGGNWGSSYSVP